jgi:hypothetical protein
LYRYNLGALPLAEPVWWKVGAAKLGGESLNYLGVGGFVIAGKQGVAVIAACQAVLMVRGMGCILFINKTPMNSCLIL